MQLTKLLARPHHTNQSHARAGNFRRLMTAIARNRDLPVEKAIETYLPRDKWPKSLSRFVGRNKAILEAIFRSKPEMSVEIRFKRKPHSKENWVNLQRLVVGQRYEVNQTPNEPYTYGHLYQHGGQFSAVLKECHFILGYPYLVLEGDKKIDVCSGGTIVKAV